MMNANCCSYGGMYGRRRRRGLEGKFIHFSTQARVVLFLSRIPRQRQAAACLGLVSNQRVRHYYKVTWKPLLASNQKIGVSSQAIKGYHELGLEPTTRVKSMPLKREVLIVPHYRSSGNLAHCPQDQAMATLQTIMKVSDTEKRPYTVDMAREYSNLILLAVQM